MASVCGSTVGSLLLSDHVYLLNGVSIACYVLTICATCLIPGHLGQEEVYSGDSQQPLDLDPDVTEWPPHLGQRRSVDDIRSDKVSQLHPIHISIAKSFKVSYAKIISRSWKTSYRSIVTLFAVPNPTFTVLIIFLLNGLANGSRELLYQYTSLALHWPLATVNRAIALQALVSAVVLLVLPTIRKVYLESRLDLHQIDLFITQTSLIVNTVGAIGLGFSATTALFIISLCVYTSGAGLADSLTTYGTLTLPENVKVADFYVRTGLINASAALLGAPFWSSLFSIVIRNKSLPLGLPFWLCAGLYTAGIVGMRTLKSWSLPIQDGLRYSPIMGSDDRPG